MDVVRVDDAGAFLDRAAAYLVADEARHNLALGIAGLLVEQPSRYAEKHFWIVADDGEAVAAAMQTPPFNLILCKPRDGAALQALAAGIERELPGVVGAHPEVDEFARLWGESHAVAPRLLRDQGVYALEQVKPIPAVSGATRTATQRDRQLLLEWLDAFGVEVLAEEDPGRREAVAMVDQRLDSDDGGFLVWEDGGEAVSIAGWGGRTPNGIRIGPVYTPPELRGRGYATALVAELSQTLLDGERRFCFLFTDLANPISNAIYERIGYVRNCESAMVAFDPA